MVPKSVIKAKEMQRVIIHNPTGGKYTPVHIGKIKTKGGWVESLTYRKINTNEYFTRALTEFGNFSFY